MTDTKEQSWDNDTTRNNDPIKQKVDKDAVKETAKPIHPQLMDDDALKSSGKEVNAVDDSIRSIHPMSAKNKSKNADIKTIDKANRYLNQDAAQYVESKYPFKDLKVDQGFFIPVEQNKTTDSLMDEMYQQIEVFRRQTAEVEKDDKGDDISESIIIHTRKRTTDGFIQLNDEGKPITGANATIRPKYIYSANFIVRPVVKNDELVEDGQKAEGDGVLVIRVL